MTCEKEYEEFLAAMEEWVAATGRASLFAGTTPIDPRIDPKPIDYAAMREAYDKEDGAKRRFFKANDAYTAAKARHKNAN